MQHPSDRLRGVSSSRLEGKLIVLGVTGSIAAVRTVELARELLRHGARVLPVMTREATRLLHPNALEFATGVKPVTELTGAVEHVAAMGVGKGKADLLLIAPCTGNTVSKLALGIDDSPVTTFAATGISTTPILVAPAMHETMNENPFLQENIERLRRAGVAFVDPVLEEGKAKLAEPVTIVEHVLRALGPRTLAGKRVLVVGGATAEPIDAMRVVSNRATGRSGVALATEAFRLGADVELWSGHAAPPAPPHVPERRFTSLQDLLGLAPHAKGFDAALVPAAIADFAPAPAKGKIPTSAGDLTLTLRPTPKFVHDLRKHLAGPLVTWKAESGLARDELVSRARASGQKAGSAFVVANLLEEVTPERSQALLVDATRATPVEGTREDVARAVLDRLAKELSG